jgi:hypothetical protein
MPAPPDIPVNSWGWVTTMASRALVFVCLSVLAVSEPTSAQEDIAGVASVPLEAVCIVGVRSGVRSDDVAAMLNAQRRASNVVPSVKAPPGANDNLIDRTIAVWQTRLGCEISREEARQIAENVTGFFSILHEWSRAELPAGKR